MHTGNRPVYAVDDNLILGLFWSLPQVDIVEGIASGNGKGPTDLHRLGVSLWVHKISMMREWRLRNKTWLLLWILGLGNTSYFNQVESWLF